MSYTELITMGIKRVRVSNGLTQEKFAELINMSVQGYRNIEQSKYLPTATTIDKICTEFNIEPVELLMPTATKDIEELQKIVITKIKNCTIDKLIKVNSMLDLL